MVALGPRLLAALASLAFLLATRAAFPEGAERSAVQYALVITLGYGHLIGAALPAVRRAATGGALGAVFALVAAATAFALYARAVAAWPAFALGLAALSVWHIAENDLAMARALRGGGGLDPLPRRPAAHAPALAASALVLVLALAALPDPGRFGDVFSTVTLYHLVAWVAFARERGARPARLAALHAGPALVCGALWLAPDAELGTAAFSPALYLFWSGLHVLQTLRGRAAA